MRHRRIENSHGHPLKNHKILLPNEYLCVACSQGKLIMKPPFTKVIYESPVFLERIHGDICGSIHPPCGPFYYFMILIDASIRQSHVCLFSTHNGAFARLLAQMIILQTQFLYYLIKTIRLDKVSDFTSQIFIDYCMSVGINIEHPITHTHTQNGLAESFVKHLQLITRPLLMKTKLPTSTQGHAIMHVAALVRIRLTTYHEYSSSRLVFGKQLDISHLPIFGCALYVPIAPTQRTKWVPNDDLGFMQVLILHLS